MTFLTGKLTFQEADALSKAIAAKQAPLDRVGRRRRQDHRQAARRHEGRCGPMPVACEPRTSGAVMNVTFQSAIPPAKKMRIKLDEKTIVDFESNRRRGFETRAT